MSRSAAIRMPRIAAGAATLALATGLAATTAAAQEADFRVATVAEGLDLAWGMDFVPGDGRLLVTERIGALRLVDPASGEIATIAGVPEVDTRRQGGLLDIALHPDFPQENWAYMTWSGANAAGETATHLGRARLDLDAGELSDLEVLFVAGPFFDSQAHYGSRIVFRDGFLFAGFGDRNFKDFGPDHIAQDRSSANGATIRLALDGTVPDDNPFAGEAGAEAAIWSYGHRNIQAMTVHPETGAVWLAEHGEAGGDEINIVEEGGNFGWPLVAYGVDYRTGETFAPTHADTDDYNAPAFHWPPGRDAHFPPSGMVFYDGAAFPEWQGRLLAGNLFHRYIGLFEVDGTSVSAPVRLMEDEGWRIRDLAIGPDDGFVYILVDDENAPLLRLEPAGESSEG